MIHWFLALIWLSFFIDIFAAKDLMVINAPVADLRSYEYAMPFGLIAPALSEDFDGKVSQLLMGEYVWAEREINNSPWLAVQAPEQMIYYNSAWTVCSGYIKKNQAQLIQSTCNYNSIVSAISADVLKVQDQNTLVCSLSMGTKLGITNLDQTWSVVTLPSCASGVIRSDNLSPIPSTLYHVDIIRANIVNIALKHVGAPYAFGGRSAYISESVDQITGADCSALINLIYLVQGLSIPRNSHSQYLKAEEMKTGADLLPGDLIFLSKPAQPKKIGHVLMYLGNELLIEATGMALSSKTQTARPDTLAVRVISWRQRFGIDRNDVISGRSCHNNRSIFLGSFLASNEMRKQMRDDFLSTLEAKVS